MLSAVGSCRIGRNSFGDVIPISLLAIVVMHSTKKTRARLDALLT